VKRVKSKQKMTFRWIFLLVLLVPLVVGGVFLVLRLEGHAPQVAHDLAEPFVGAPRDIVLDITERGRGLQTIRVLVVQGGREAPLEEIQFEGSMLWAGSGILTHRLPVNLDARALSLEDGDALMRIEVRDYSWRNWWHGNLTVTELPLLVDTRAPQIEVLSRQHYVNQGGAGVVVYRLTETCPSHGVEVSGHFYPGFPAGGKDPKTMIAFFAVSYDQNADTAVLASATDFAGNQTKMGFHCRIRSKSFRKDVLNISDTFIRSRMVPLLAAAGQSETDLKAVFLAVNRDMRKANYETLTGLGQQTVSEMMWQGPFLRLPKAANRAQFADHRVYRYKGNVVDRQVHLGADLASVQQSPVPAANNGRVVFAATVGIYGNTVVIDHGFGLFSLYAHLSEIKVAAGDRVDKGDTIGQTGVTGLAAGDHLHFGMMLHDTFVNPIEWWDDHWINDNILTKLKLVEPVS
jgi:Peptidase family M23